jgi:hypothetical protein
MLIFWMIYSMWKLLGLALDSKDDIKTL